MNGLRLRTALLLLTLTLLIAAASIGLGRQTLDTLRHELGAALVRDHARLAQQRIQSRIGLELALSQRLAASRTVQDWLADESHPARRSAFLQEAEGYRQSFSSRSYFIAGERSRMFHYADPRHGGELRPGYRVSEQNPENAWYFTTLRQTDGYWINVDFDKTLGITNVWINAAARAADGRTLGVVGTGIDLGAFLREILGNPEPGILTMIVDRHGTIVAHPDTSRMQFDLAAASDSEKTLYRQLEAKDASLIRQLLASNPPETDSPSTFAARLDGQPRLLAHATINRLGWHVITALDLESRSLLTPERISGLLLACALLLGLLLVSSTLGVDVLVLRPLRQLIASAHAIAAGDYNIRLTSQRTDELGELTRTFDHMAAQVRSHSQNLEQLVAERTAALSAAHRKLTDSIRYASLIQHAVLPDRQLAEEFTGEYFTLWLPRDVVGGDLYFYRNGPQGQLLGVIDCAGHGVPGACMTMIAHAALDLALGEAAWDDPATLISRLDAIVRRMLPQEHSLNQIATSLDIGLCHLAPARDRLTFSGACVSLLWSDGDGLHLSKGGRRAINDRRQGSYTNQTIPLLGGQTFYLTTDGLLDQAGGEQGHAFGLRRLEAWVRAQGSSPLREQRASLQATLDAYRGSQAQRDDITLLAFRVDPSS